MPRNCSDLLNGGVGGRWGNTLETIREGCFCPLTTALRCPALQKKDTNLNVKVSIINQLGGEQAPGGRGGRGSGVRGWGCVLGVTRAKGEAGLWTCASLLMERAGTAEDVKAAPASLKAPLIRLTVSFIEAAALGVRILRQGARWAAPPLHTAPRQLRRRLRALRPQT